LRTCTSGAAGSNHALAVAIYGRECGFAVTLMLFGQPPLPGIGATLLADAATGAAMFHDAEYPRHIEHLREMADECARADGVPPYVIPAGGSCATGVVGFVNAAFELGEQVARGLLPEPAAIYTAFGTMGTAAGLLLGLKAAGLRSRLVAVRVVPEVVANREKFAALFEASNRLLVDIDPSFPRCSFDGNDLTLRDDFFGGGYGVATEAGLAAIEAFASSVRIALDPVYTGKTAAALLADARGGMSDGPLLYWHTKSGIFPPARIDADYRLLPAEFHRYFTAAENADPAR